MEADQAKPDSPPGSLKVEPEQPPLGPRYLSDFSYV